MFLILTDKFTNDLEQRYLIDNFRQTVRLEGFESDIPVGRLCHVEKGKVYLTNVNLKEMQPVIDAGLALEVEHQFFCKK
ncbi:hypothetical protein VITU102760_24455 [Vibrio tubiashii]|jgi:hypothetical protein|uniref:Uncharacterized protein n=1 Tax=Vibrio tubiashii ATCC 19109 TaxID=1051646 RepID=F9T5D5_9VIBR|nr:hypothetical protein [Vibrio tubiashii]AIW17415.1 hypothetical protein IX91_25500 [Vibrio tubiashii ATCC 19109]EGU55332.1 hypothetical protein VITU9109_21339 [Vibrio tubiashii ATCC 19109]EIF04387.1 hypothetical protein VT1337_08471 [Vibrio tubiashii NCIMB 1337 = ATCC 19106]